MAHLTVDQCTQVIAWCNQHLDQADQRSDQYTIWESEWIDAWWPHTGLGDTEPNTHHCQIILTPPGSYMPLHQDTHGRYRRHQGVAEHRSVHRHWASLSEPAIGHVLMFDDACWYNVPQGEIRSLWSVGRHVAANLGDTDRWTMVVDAVSMT